MQQIEASSILDGSDKEDSLAIVKQMPSQKRSRKSSARVLLQHCSICGCIDHKCSSCPHKDWQGEGIPDQSQAVISFWKNKRMAALVSRLKYTQLHLRTTEFNERASKMARAPLARDFLTLARAYPGTLAQMLLDDKLLDNLQGVPCPREKCQAAVGAQGYLSSTKTLGTMRVNNNVGWNISKQTVFHSCDVCNVKQSVALYNPLFAGFVGGHGSHGVSMAVLAFWNALEGVPEYLTIRQLNIGEQLCSHLYFRAQSVMAYGAIRMQNELVWGTGTSETVECEVDCTVICKWQVVEDGRFVYYYYVYMGARQRGSTRHFAIHHIGTTKCIKHA